MINLMQGYTGNRIRMQGLFNQTDYYFAYTPYERNGQFDKFKNVMMERDIGPFKKGVIVSYAQHNTFTGDVWLEQVDENDKTVDSFYFKVKVSYEVLPAP